MRKILPAILIPLSVAVHAQDKKEIIVKTDVKAVTIFTKGAQPTRKKTVDLPAGKSVIKFTELSPYIDEKSIQVKTSNEVIVLSVNRQLNYTDSTPSANQLIKLKKKNNTIEALNTKHFEVNTNIHSITIRGDFWYEGIFFATSIGNSTLITYRVNNIARKSRIFPRLSKWLIPLWQFRRPKKMRLELQKFIQQIGEQLQCHAHLERLTNK